MAQIKYLDSRRIMGASSDTVGTPTFEDDYSSNSGWTQIGTGIDVNNSVSGKVGGAVDRSVNRRVYRDLGSALSDTKWTVRFEYQLVSNSGNGSEILFQIGDSTGAYMPNTGVYTAVGDVIGLRQDGNAIYVLYQDNATQSGGSNTIAISTATTYYITVIRDGSNITYTIKTGSHSGTTVDSKVQSMGSNPTSLRYLGHGNRYDGQSGSDSWWVDNIEIYDGVTSVTNKPTDVQDNSLFIEKDTARRYWFTPQTVDTEEVFSFTTTDTAGALWGNRIYGMKLLSGHSGLNKYIKKAETYHPTNPTGSRLTTGTLYHVILDSSGTEIARSAGVSASSVSNNSWAETTFSSPVKLLENYTVGVTISTGDANTYLGLGINNNSSSPTNTTRYYKDESGSASTATTETVLMVFDSDPATGLSVVTWNMQPTFQDDFSTNNFNDTGTKIGVANNTLEWDGTQNGSVNGSTIDLTSIDTKAIFRAKLRINTLTAPSSASNFVLIGFSDSDHTTAGDSNQDGIGLIIQNDADVASSFRAMHVDGAPFSPNAGTVFATVPATATDYFIEVVLDNSTWYVRIYSDSNYSVLIEQETGSMTATGLRYFGIKMRSSASVNGTFDGYIDDFKFYNGVTSVQQ